MSRIRVTFGRGSPVAGGVGVRRAGVRLRRGRSAEPYVYAADLAGGVAQLDASGGALTPLTPPAVGGPNAQVVATSPDGEDVYTAGSAIGQYDVGANGALTPKTPATVPSGGFNIGIAVSPDGSSAYVTDYMADSVRQFDIAADGTLSPKAQAAVATATEPTGWPSAPTARTSTWRASTPTWCRSSTWAPTAP
jgi:DNA-binding beta-propeller fold protein YncE